MEGSVVDRAVAEEGNRDAIGSQQLETITCTGGLQDARANDSAGAHQSDFGGKQVHGSAAASRAAGAAAEEFNRYNERKIVIRDKQLANERFNGVFRVDDPEAFVRAVGQSLNVHVGEDVDQLEIG